MELIWLYLVRAHLQEVLAAGVMTPRRTSNDKNETPAVWFSTQQDWEPMAHPPILCNDGSTRPATRDLLFTIGAGPARIGVAPEVAPHSWHEFKRLSHISAKHASEIQSLSVAAGSRSSWWRYGFEAVPRSQWQAVEQWDGWQWISLPV